MSKRLTTPEFVAISVAAHWPRRYGYTKTVYKNRYTPVTITCEIHGDFEQLPDRHMRKKGCRRCGHHSRVDKLRGSKDGMIRLREERYGSSKYDHSLVVYVNAYTKVTLGCPDHGLFAIAPRHYISGKGCPTCKESKGEMLVAKELTWIDVTFGRQTRFPTCKNKRPLPFDFSVSVGDRIALIEYHGEQHYEPRIFGDRINPSPAAIQRAGTKFKRVQERDLIKERWCRENGVPLLVIPHWQLDEVPRLVAELVTTLRGPAVVAGPGRSM